MVIPLQNFLVVEQEANEMKMVNGIWIPEEQRPSKQFDGIIVSVGPMVKSPDLRPGTIVALNAMGQVIRREEIVMREGKEVKKLYVLVREQDIVAILKDDRGTKAGKMIPIMDSPYDYGAS